MFKVPDSFRTSEKKKTQSERPTHTRLAACDRHELTLGHVQHTGEYQRLLRPVGRSAAAIRAHARSDPVEALQQNYTQLGNEARSQTNGWRSSKIVYSHP